MSWNSNQNNGGSQASNRKNVRCNNQDFDITGLSGVALTDRLKAIARDNDISKFDIYDSLNTNLDAIAKHQEARRTAKANAEAAALSKAKADADVVAGNVVSFLALAILLY